MYLLSLFFKRKKLVSPSFLLNPPPCHLFFDHNDYKHFVHILSSDEQSKCLIYLLFYKSLCIWRKTEHFPISKTGVNVRP